MIKSLYNVFKKWSEGGSVWIISDPHFNDEDCKLMDPSWIDADEYVKKINTEVHKGDTLICLGDVGNPWYIEKIKAGYKVLIMGNHDKNGEVKEVFDEVYDGPLFIGDRILLSHEPVYGLSWCVNIHGHDHNCVEKYADGCKHVNLAANIVGYVPWNLGKAIKNGLLSDIKNIHRTTIDKAIEVKNS